MSFPDHLSVFSARYKTGNKFCGIERERNCMKNSFWTLIFVLGILIGATVACKLAQAEDNPTPQRETNVSSPKKESKNERENKKEPAATNEETAIRSTELIEIFRSDKNAANAKYKGKTILISGKITNINDVFGTMALNLRDSENAIGLQCYLADNDDVKKVAVGQEVVIRGKVRGDGTDVIDNAVVIQAGTESEMNSFSTAYPHEISRNIQ